MLVGRDRECARLDRVLCGARGGEAKVLVLLGEPGIGKTSLLDYVAGRASDMTVVRAVGLESEAELQFSALFDVCRPLLARLDELADRQRDALQNAIGTGSGAPADRFSVGAATLSLLAAAAEDAPLLVLLDDVHWVDAASTDALVFAGRRLAAERVAMVVAVRTDEADVFSTGAFETLNLGGVDDEAAAALVEAHAGANVSPDVARRVCRATRGSPLALVELAGLLTSRQLQGLEPIADPVPVGATVQRKFAERADGLPERARAALLVAALSSSPRLEPVVEALRLLELDPEALDAAQDAELVNVDSGRIAFRHPLVRSAVVETAASSARRRAHRALAQALEDRSPDERAWHLAAAALGPDEQAAAELAKAGARMRARSGWASAALALERSARLTPDRATREARLLDAAESAWVAGRIEPTLALTDELLENEGTNRARAVCLRSQIELHCGDVGRALGHLLEGAGLLEREEPALAAALLADAVEAAELLGEPDHGVKAALRAASLMTDDGQEGFITELALGQALRLAGRAVEARPHLERALLALSTQAELQGSMRACTRGARAAGWLARVPEGLHLVRGAVELARDQGAFGPLAHALEVTAGLGAQAGQWREAYGHASEGLELARAVRCAWAHTRCLEHLAWLDAVQGDEDRCRAHAAQATQAAGDAGFRSERAGAALVLLELGLGRAQEAARRYEATGHSNLHTSSTGDLVEALVRSGRTDDAETAQKRLRAGDADAVAARCAGLLAGDDGFEAPFADALDLHPAHDAFGLARTRLCFGERLRRAGRRLDARVQLRCAHEELDRLGARPWAERAAAELRATGERLGRRKAQHGDELTPQELQVALQAAEGKTNKEIGAALFLSPKTVDFHLHRVFRKLDVRSRGDLIRHFAVGRAK